MEIILNIVQTTILITISYLLYAFCITRLNTKYLFIFEVHVYHYCFSLINILQNASKFPSVPPQVHRHHEYVTSQWESYESVMMPHSISSDAMMPYIAMCSACSMITEFYLFKPHENCILSFLQLCSLISFTFADQHIWIKG